ncbi:MAG: hypothetical protein COA90_03140 [Gammaproteobacteria bacterium]|nr:MAG: hypothetical protein COA90_03140 [Gammaproteobacteria bacterium]
MKLFVYEHITSGALIDESLPDSLAHEGNQMLLAIIGDFTQLANLELTILRDVRLQSLSEFNHHCDIIKDTASFQDKYAQAVNQADFILLIAPETNNILSNLQRDLHDAKATVLGCKIQATALCSDKYHCYKTLISSSINTPETLMASDFSATSFDADNGYIVKPYDGAGCIDTQSITNKHNLLYWLANSEPDILNPLIIQAKKLGESLSLSLLYSEQDVVVLAINQQHIKQQQGEIHFTGSTVNADISNIFSLSQAYTLAMEVHQAIAGLWGLVGIDIIVNDSEVSVIDINPRVTSSYIGLHQSIGLNPAELLLTMNNQSIADLPVITQRLPIEVSL